uniref:DC_STAMP domain-containing protein n=1 Tax=Caenorhabditis tropicalis TaxID=1561998 RepID=A0A1I7UZM3_9PELO
MSRRVRRDSETSTDSWSLVEEEDRLDDDFSLHSTDNDEGAEPIIEEPPTSDEETASEKSIDSSEDEDSEFSDEEEEEDSENEEEEIQESQEILENSDISDEESEDSESDDSEEEDDVASEIAEVLEMNDEELAEAAARLKEDEKWMDQELEECESQETRRSCRVLLAFTVFLMIFPLAELFTSWMLTYQNHRFVSRNVDYVDRFVFEDYGSQQSYPSKLTEEQLDKAWVEKVTRHF